MGIKKGTISGVNYWRILIWTCFFPSLFLLSYAFIYVFVSGFPGFLVFFPSLISSLQSVTSNHNIIFSSHFALRMIMAYQRPAHTHYYAATITYANQTSVSVVSGNIMRHFMGILCYYVMYISLLVY